MMFYVYMIDFYLQYPCESFLIYKLHIVLLIAITTQEGGGVTSGKKDRDDHLKSKKTNLKLPSHKICAP